ncbi:hypothetical protein VZQ01_36065 [Myxococcus faecalis]|uniref:hypothetical protein n=1 Tax=Myxococcus faecalis TaxID=3115646 RepID=UPI0038D08F0F
MVALVNGQPVMEEVVVEAKRREQPAFIRARYAISEKTEFLDNLSRLELLAQEARRVGLDKEPEILATPAKVMVQKLLRQQQEATGTPSETELRKHLLLPRLVRAGGE